MVSQTLKCSGSREDHYITFVSYFNISSPELIFLAIIVSASQVLSYWEATPELHIPEQISKAPLQELQAVGMD